MPHDFGEAFRALRTALVASSGTDATHLIAITSTQPLEGKTTTAVNIALALAIGGARVLLIDADMRRPSLHKAMRLPNDRGLAELLSGKARMREVVQRCGDPNLLVIPAGVTPSNPSELLASDRMRAFLHQLATGPFDWVIIDTPPVLAVTDAVILAPLVHSVSFVVGADMTRWRLAERAIETLQAGHPRSIAAILNRVDFDRNRYYYSRYYGHQYRAITRKRRRRANRRWPSALPVALTLLAAFMLASIGGRYVAYPPGGDWRGRPLPAVRRPRGCRRGNPLTRFRARRGARRWSGCR